jgi:hypothetical protein
LEYRGEFHPVAREREVANIGPVDFHRASGRIVKPQKEVGEGRFSRTGVSDERDA